MKYKILALDLDGTLTDSKKKISERAKHAVQSAIEHGVTIALSSGRPLIGIRRISRELELERLGGYIIAYNGGAIIDCSTGARVFERLIPPKYIPQICSEAKRFGVTALTYDDHGVVSESDDDPYVKRECYNNSIPVYKTADLSSYVTWPVEKFMVVGEPEHIASALSGMTELFEGKLNVFLSERYFIEVTPLGVKKDAALQTLLKYLNYDRHCLMAVGDGLNDIPMLQLAGLSVAMGNSCPEVKAIADTVTASNDEDGVAIAIEKYILG